MTLCHVVAPQKVGGDKSSGDSDDNVGPPGKPASTELLLRSRSISMRRAEHDFEQKFHSTSDHFSK